MPIYEYLCQSCGTKFEKFVRSGAGSEGLKCPKCESVVVDKVFSIFGAVRGGSGASGTGSLGGGCSPTFG